MAQPVEPIRVLVVDDEAPARQRLLDLLKKDPQVGSILEAANGKVAVEIIRREALDLVFLDVLPRTISTLFAPLKRTPSIIC
jgi:two-component system, LytTR family, response regulator